MSNSTDRWMSERVLAFAALRPEQALQVLQQEVGMGLITDAAQAETNQQILASLRAFEHRLARLERIREVAWKLARLSTRETFLIFSSSVLIVLLMTGYLSYDQLIRLIEALGKATHGASAPG